MKLVMAIINDEDSYNVTDSLNEQGFQVTKLASTGGFLRSGNTTLIIGVEDDRVSVVKELIERTCKARTQMTQANAPSGSVEGYIPYPIEINVGGATIFVLEIAEFKKV